MAVVSKGRIRLPGRHKNGYSCRCWNRKCQNYGDRVTRRHHPESYRGANARWGQCRCCKRVLAVDWHRTSGAEARADTCRDGMCGYGFPHRRGSLYCNAFKGNAARRAEGIFGHYFQEVA